MRIYTYIRVMLEYIGICKGAAGIYRRYKELHRVVFPNDGG